MKNGEHVGCSEPISSENTEKTNKLMQLLHSKYLLLIGAKQMTQCKSCGYWASNYTDESRCS